VSLTLTLTERQTEALTKLMPRSPYRDESAFAAWLLDRAIAAFAEAQARQGTWPR